MNDFCDVPDLWPLNARHWIEVHPQLVRVIEVLGAYGVRMQLETGEVGEPREGRGVARHDFVRLPSRGKAQRGHLDPVGTRLRCALLKEVVGLDSVRITNEHVRPPPRGPQRSLRDREVVTR